MDYSIIGLSDAAKKTDNLPAIKVQTGLNKVDIEMEHIKGLEINKPICSK